MQKREVKSLGYIYHVDVPTSYDEFDQMAGKADAALEEAISNVIYRGTNADFRGAFLDAVEEKLVAEFGNEFKRKEFESGRTKKVKDEDGNEVEEAVAVLEKEGVYEKRVVAQLVEGGIIASDANEIKQAYFQSIIDDLESAIDDDGKPVLAFDPKQRERKVQSKRVPQYIYNTVDQLMSLGNEAVERARQKLQSELGIDIPEGDREAFAKALHIRETSRDRDLERAKALAS